MPTKALNYSLILFLLILVDTNSFSQDITFNEVRILNKKGNKNSKGQFIEFKNNSSNSMSLRGFYLATSKEKLAESEINSGARYMRAHSVSSLPVNQRYYTQLYFEENEKRTLYLGALQNEKIIILDSISVPVLSNYESYSKIDEQFSIQPVATPNLENWETKLPELLHRKQFSIGAGPNINFPKTTSTLKNETSSAINYGIDIRYIMNSKRIFYTFNTGYFNRNYDIDSETSIILPIGDLKRTTKGKQKFGQIKFGSEIGLHITPRLSIMSGINIGLSIKNVQEYSTASTLILIDGSIIEENEDVTDRKKFIEESSIDLYYSLGIKYFHTNRIVSGLTYMNDLTGNVSEGAIRNKTLQLYISYLLNLSKKTVTKHALIK